MNLIYTARATAVIITIAIIAGMGGAQGDAAPGQRNDAVPPGDAPILLDVIGGVASTHVIVRTEPGIGPVRLDDGRWGFAARNAAADRRRILEVDAADLAPAEIAVANLLERRGTTGIRPALSVVPKNEAMARELGLDRYYAIDVPHGTNTPALADALRAAAPGGAFFEIVELDGIGGVASPPNDPQFVFQYALHNTGQSICNVAGVAGADLGALAAWEIATGSDDLIIAVLDSGLHDHVDLAGRVLPGYNVFTGDDSTPDDCSSHGTAVTGIIAANTDNAIGMAGITWQSKVIPVRVVNPCGGQEAHVADGVIWATDAGAHIINMSLQYYTGTTYFHNAVIYARNSGAVIIAASGNNQPAGTVAWPAKWPEVIAVAGTNNRDEKYGSSNSGPEISVAAAGECVRSLNLTAGYANKFGTSFAAPHVSGTAALMLSLDPSLTHDEIQSILEETAVDLGPPGWDPDFGHGRIDAYSALLEVQAGMTKPGDLNGDGSVGVADLLILLAAWGPCADCTPGECPADLSGNCNVGVADLLILLENWG